MNVAALFSGGKDSVFATYIAQQYGWNVTHLVTIHPKNPESWMFHAINVDLTPLLAQALGIPLVHKTSLGKKETELHDLRHLLQDLPIDGVISGAIASEYQRTRIEEICDDLHLKSFTPLWHKDQEALLRDQVRAGFSICIVGVSAQGFDRSWLGRMVTMETIEDLVVLKKNCSIHLAGEGGEYETLVLDGPCFKKKLVLDKTAVQWKRDHGTFIVKSAHLE